MSSRLFLANKDTREQCDELIEAHKNTWSDLYPKAEYIVEESIAMFQTRYLLYVELNEAW
jgi:hypothetical protein